MSEGNRPPGMAGGWCQSAERGEALAGGRERRGKVAAAARRGGARLWRPRRVAGLPPSRPRAPVTHMRARALSGSSRLGDTSLRARRVGQRLPASGSATRKRFSRRWPGPRTQRETSSRPTLRNRSGEVAERGGNSRGIWKACVLAPPGVRLALLRLLRTRTDLVTQISPIYTLPPLYRLPAGSVVGITKLCALRKLLQQFYCNISILTSLNLVPAKQVYGTD